MLSFGCDCGNYGMKEDSWSGWFLPPGTGRYDALL